MALGPFFVGEKISFTFTIRDKDTNDIINLQSLYEATPTGKVRVILRKVGAAANRETTAMNEIASTPDSATAGTVSYLMATAWASTETGQWDAQVLLAFTNARKTERFRFTVESALATVAP